MFLLVVRGSSSSRNIRKYKNEEGDWKITKVNRTLVTVLTLNFIHSLFLFFTKESIYYFSVPTPTSLFVGVNGLPLRRKTTLHRRSKSTVYMWYKFPNVSYRVLRRSFQRLHKCNNCDEGIPPSYTYPKCRRVR